MPNVDITEFMRAQQESLAAAEAIADPTERRDALCYRAAAYLLAAAAAAERGAEARTDADALSNDAAALVQRPSFRESLARNEGAMLRDMREGRFDRMGETLLRTREAQRKKYASRFSTPPYAAESRLETMDRVLDTLELIDMDEPAPAGAAYEKARFAIYSAREKLSAHGVPSWEDNLEVLDCVRDYFAEGNNALPGANGGRGEELLRAAACAAGGTREFQALCDAVNRARGAKPESADYVSPSEPASPYLPEEGTLGALMEQTAEAAVKEGTFTSKDCRAAFCTYLAAALMARRMPAGLETALTEETAGAVRQDARRLGQSGELMGLLRQSEREPARRDALLAGMSAYGELGSGVDRALVERREERLRERSQEKEKARTQPERTLGQS